MPSIAIINSSDDLLDPSLDSWAPHHSQHDRYKRNGQDLLLKSLHELELLHSEVLVPSAEGAELMVDRISAFTRALQSEYTSTYIGSDGSHPPIPREFAPAGPASTLPQRKSKGKAKARTLTGVEMVERKRKRSRNMPSEDVGPSSTLNEMQDCIQVIRSTAPV